MGNNQFGRHFCTTTWGESHGKAIGAVIDGCPAGLAISEEEINEELSWRRPGSRKNTSERNEPDKVEILSGVYNGITTGAPISLIIYNRDAKGKDYSNLAKVFRPGHANFTYLKKYDIFDPRGGGRASARETAMRVAAGAIAKKFLTEKGISVCAFLSACGPVQTDVAATSREQVRNSPLFCPDGKAEKEMVALLENLEGDSVGGVVEFRAENLPVGLGDPVYNKLEARMADAFLSIPASKGFEIGEGMRAASMRGSQHNDLFVQEGITDTNRAGGTLGGISTGMPLIARVAFKPTSSIKIEQKTIDLEGNPTTIAVPKEGRHDPCVAIRAVPVVEAMGALVLIDLYLSSRLDQFGDL